MRFLAGSSVKLRPGPLTSTSCDFQPGIVAVAFKIRLVLGADRSFQVISECAVLVCRSR